MEKPSLEEVKEYFKNAETVENQFGKTIKVDLKNKLEQFSCGSVVQGFNAEEWVCLFHDKRGYAKILTYKNTEPKFEITKEQISIINARISEAVKKELKEWFPEAFETFLEVGKWYIVTNIKTGSLGFKGIGQYTKEKPESGLLETDLGFNFIDVRGRIWRTNGNIRLATTEEVTETLKKEAVKRGVCNGYFESIHGIYNIQHHQLQDPFYYADNADILYYKGRAVYSKGIWAEIIQTKTIKEAEELLKELGHEIKIVS